MYVTHQNMSDSAYDCLCVTRRLHGVQSLIAQCVLQRLIDICDTRILHNKTKHLEERVNARTRISSGKAKNVSTLALVARALPPTRAIDRRSSPMNIRAIGVSTPAPPAAAMPPPVRTITACVARLFTTSCQPSPPPAESVDVSAAAFVGGCGCVVESSLVDAGGGSSAHTCMRTQIVKLTVYIAR